MNLTGLDLDHLRRGLRGHPRVAKHVAGLDLEPMSKHQLLALTEKLGVDARAVIDARREQDAELLGYSREFPAFKGKLDFDLTIEVLGKRVTRKARAEYAHTPDWEHWDLQLQAPFVGWPSSSLTISVRTTSRDGWGGGPVWTKIDVLDIGQIWEILDDAIEARCVAEDAKRRRAAARKRRGKAGRDQRARSENG
jgi:hypothetical protein